MARSEAPFKYFVVDAFTSSPLKGNPAVVCFLDKQKDQECLQAMAQEFKWLTCYLTKVIDMESSSNIPRYNLRWFTPTLEVKICAHGTLASAHAIFSTGMVQGNDVEFVTKSGVLLAKRILENQNGETLKKQLKSNKFLIQLCFPLYSAVQLDPSEINFIPKSLKGQSTINFVKMSRENDLIVELESSKDVIDFNPIEEDIAKWPGRGVAITAIAPYRSGFDFFTRLFAPNAGIMEDHVCGSIHCVLAPYWSKKLGKSHLKVYMASPRGGTLMLHVEEESHSVTISGEAVTVMEVEEAKDMKDVQWTIGKSLDQRMVELKFRKIRKLLGLNVWVSVLDDKKEKPAGGENEKKDTYDAHLGVFNPTIIMNK
ncbi:hypothetical protein BVRB_9g222340 [Beta vulgaris subsp. vulgaris]|nr:hypothetical protein BVRB_9g222340 [Beta vulgaris subsp. vulgaris]